MDLSPQKTFPGHLRIGVPGIGSGGEERAPAGSLPGLYISPKLIGLSGFGIRLRLCRGLDVCQILGLFVRLGLGGILKRLLAGRFPGGGIQRFLIRVLNGVGLLSGRVGLRDGNTRAGYYNRGGDRRGRVGEDPY